MSAAPDLGFLRRKLFAMSKELGLDEDGRREAMIAACGKASTRDMDEAEFMAVIDWFRDCGVGRVASKSARRRPPDPRADQRFIHVMWRLLGEAGAVEKGPAALRAFIAADTFAAKWGEAATDVRFLSVERAYDVIEALKALCHRHGVKLEPRR